MTEFPHRTGKWLVSSAGGNFPRWRRDGTEIFYQTQDNILTAARVSLGTGTFEVRDVQRLFEIRPRLTGARAGQVGYAYDVSADGQRFLVNTLVEESSTQAITVLVNWPALLNR